MCSSSARRERRRAEALLAKVGIADKPQPLPGASVRRPAAARGDRPRARHATKVMLFDEPTSALDPELVGEVLRVMRAARRRGPHHDRGHARNGLRARRILTSSCSCTRARIEEEGPPDQSSATPSRSAAPVPCRCALTILLETAFALEHQMSIRPNSLHARDIAHASTPTPTPPAQEDRAVGIARGEGVYVYDDSGRRYIEAHGRPVVRLARLQRAAAGDGGDAADARAALLAQLRRQDRTNRPSSWPRR